MSVTATILGREELLRKLTTMPDSIKAQVRAAMAEQANEIVAMMKSLAPVLKSPDPRRTPGALRDSIGWTWGTVVRKRAMTIGVMGNKRDPTMIISFFAGGEEAYWAWWMELGTVRLAAQPYFFVSWRANKKGAKAAIRAAVRRGVAGQATTASAA